jgi:uncharacterized protein
MAGGRRPAVEWRTGGRGPARPRRRPVGIDTMTRRQTLALGGALALLCLPAVASQAQRPDYPFQPVPFTRVQLTDVFWAPRIEVNRTASIPTAFEQCERTQRVYHFERAARALRGEPLDNTRPPGYPFDDTDVYKVIEGAAYTLSVVPDPKLDAYVDGLIAKIAAAQEPDGYLYTTRTINPKEPHRWAGRDRWVLVRDDSHELYNLGHMFEAAVAHHLATGKRNFLDVAVKAADLLVRTFGPGRRSTWPGHQLVEMALVRLYRVTGKEEYLDLAKFFLDERGPGPDPENPIQFPDGERANPRGLQYNQAHLKVIEQSEPVGHAVRAVYMYAGMADVAALTGDRQIRDAGLRIWNHLMESKLYITGGIGASGSGEAFGKPYELPNATAYAETCASIGMDFWAHRLFLLEGDAQYIDVMERTLYNGLISGVSLDGTTYFYPNPLESNGRHARSPWFGVACCPGNITRFMASVPGYFYATRGNDVYVNLYAAGTANVDTPAGTVQVVQDTQYPWDGAIRLTVTPERSRRFTLHVRIPGWAREQPVPSDLYRYPSIPFVTHAVKINGELLSQPLDKGYVAIDRAWEPGDVVEVDLPMLVRRVVSHPNVEANRGRVALQRGPIVYAAEWPDNPGGKVRNIVLPDGQALSSEFRADLLNGVQVITGRAFGLKLDEKGAVQKAEQPFTAIPYATWANRGRGEMAVWLARTDDAATPAPYPTLAMAATLTASREQGQGWLRSIVEGDEPRSSRAGGSMFNWWPVQGWSDACEPDAPERGRPQCSRGEHIDMTFAKPSRVSEVEIYWFDDAPRPGQQGGGGVRVPASWRLLYRGGDAWRPVETSMEYGLAADAWNRVAFTPVTTSALRLEVVMQPRFSAGLQEWRVR